MSVGEFEGGQVHSSAVLSARCFQNRWAKQFLCPVYDKWRKEQGCIEIFVAGAPFMWRGSIQGLTKGMSQLQRKEAFHRNWSVTLCFAWPQGPQWHKRGPQHWFCSNKCLLWVSVFEEQWQKGMTRGSCFQPLFPKGLSRRESSVQPDWGEEMRVMESSS